MSSIASSSILMQNEVRRGEPSLAAIRVWLYAVAMLIFVMVIVGGATRLTDSGLSITEWQPILGVIPPLTEADWLAALEKYRQIPEYQLINKGMSLEAFKTIYWWEWAHRFLGRVIGIAFFAPLVFFWVRGQIPKTLLSKLIAIFLLGSAQGALGWYMVQSGLAERTDVSQYRLAAHLGLAFIIYGAILWVAFGLGQDRRTESARQSGLLRATALVLAALIFLQVFAGGFVAGTDAGMSHNTWPLMDGAIIPDGLGAMQPWYLNLFENVLTVQFNHRMLGYLIAVVSLIAVIAAWRGGEGWALRLAALVFAAVMAQIALGVLALLTQLEIGWALAHQGGAAILFGLSLYQLHSLRSAA